jgi:hypothetical protein
MPRSRLDPAITRSTRFPAGFNPVRRTACQTLEPVPDRE